MPRFINAKIILSLAAILLIAAGCSGGSTSGYSSDPYDDYDYYDDYSDVPSEPENPYSSYEEGHYAGYEWAEENEVDSCGGNSQSFIEGCEEYVNQRDEYDAWEDEAEQEYDEGYYDDYPY